MTPVTDEDTTFGVDSQLLHRLYLLEERVDVNDLKQVSESHNLHIPYTYAATAYQVLACAVVSVRA